MGPMVAEPHFWNTDLSSIKLHWRMTNYGVTNPCLPSRAIISQWPRKHTIKMLLSNHSHLLVLRKTEPFTVLVWLPGDMLLPHKKRKDPLVFIVHPRQLWRCLATCLGTGELAFKKRKKIHFWGWGGLREMTEADGCSGWQKMKTCLHLAFISLHYMTTTALIAAPHT